MYRKYIKLVQRVAIFTILIIIICYGRFKADNMKRTETSKELRNINPAKHHENIISRSWNRITNKSDPCYPFKNVVSVMDGGWLGNQMSEYATLIAVAKCTGYQPVMSTQKAIILKDIFNNLRIPVNNKCAKSLNEMRQISAVGLCELYGRGRLKGNHRIVLMDPNGLPLYHFHYADDVRKHFLFNKVIDTDVEKYFKNIEHQQPFTLQNKSESNGDDELPVYIGIHVRRQMYQVHLNKYGFDLVTVGWFIAAIEKLVSIVSLGSKQLLILVITSDDPTWVNANFLNPFRGLTTSSLQRTWFQTFAERFQYLMVSTHEYYSRVAVDPVYFDLAVLAKCNHTIFDYGTYGYWGAFIANGTTVITDGYPEDVLGPLARHAWLIESSDKWIGLDITSTYTTTSEN